MFIFTALTALLFATATAVCSCVINLPPTMIGAMLLETTHWRINMTYKPFTNNVVILYITTKTLIDMKVCTHIAV